jgi:hypothetical protein
MPNASRLTGLLFYATTLRRARTTTKATKPLSSNTSAAASGRQSLTALLMDITLLSPIGASESRAHERYEQFCNDS